jgi:GAF domain-containing protein
MSWVAQFLHTLPDPSEHLDLVLERIAAIMNLKAGLVLLLDQKAGHLTLVAHRSLPEIVTRDLWAYPLRPPEGVAGQVAATGEPLLICGVEAADSRMARASLRAVGFRDVMAVPLAAGSAILGVLLLGSHSPRVLTDEDLALFTAIGQQLGLALKNDQLLRSTRAMEALREADRLKAELARNVGRVLTTRLLVQRVWGAEYGDETDYVKGVVRRLRMKLEPDPAHPRYIITEPHVGYRLSDS